MTGELIPTGVTFGDGRKSINTQFSGTAEFNNIILESGANFSGGTGGGIIYSGGTDLYDIFATSISGSSTASNGLTETAGEITLGGFLTNNTTIDTDNFLFSIEGEGGVNIKREGSSSNVFSELILPSAETIVRLRSQDNDLIGQVETNPGSINLSTEGVNNQSFSITTSAGAVFSNQIRLGNLIGTGSTAGMIRWDGSNFQGYDGSSWSNLDDSNNFDYIEISTTSNNSNIETPFNWFGIDLFGPNKTYTLKDQATASWPVNSEIIITNTNPDEVLLSADTGVSIKKPKGKTYFIKSGGTIRLKRFNTDNWIVAGDLNHDFHDFGSTSGELIWNMDTLSKNAKVTLSGDVLLQMSNISNGESGSLIVKQDSVGGHNLSFAFLDTGHFRIRGGFDFSKFSGDSTEHVLKYVYDGTDVFFDIGYDYI